MAIGRISGSVLKSNLTRNGTDLAFETNLLYLDVTTIGFVEGGGFLWMRHKCL